MPAYSQIAAFMERVRAVNPNYSRVRTSSLAPLVALLNSPHGNALQVADAITRVTRQLDPVYGNKANKYKDALNFLQRTYPGRRGWVQLGAHRSRAVRYFKVEMPKSFNPIPPDYANTRRLNPTCELEGGSVEDFIYTANTKVGAVLIHIDKTQPGMETVIDGMTVVNHMRSVLLAIQHCGGGACALHIGDTQPVCGDIAKEFNNCTDTVTVNEPGSRHMGAAHDRFNDFVKKYSTIVVMGFDADVCVRANLFGAPEYKTQGLPAGTSSLPPLTSQADVVTSRALLVTTGVINPSEYGLLQGT